MLISILTHYTVKNSLCTHKAQKIEAVDYTVAHQQFSPKRGEKKNKMHNNTHLTNVINLDYHAIKYHLQRNCS